MNRYLLALALLLAAAAPPVHATDEDDHELVEAVEIVPARPLSVVQVIEAAAARHGVSAAWMLRIARCESRLDPYARGQAGERGLYQLHPRGLLPTFRAWGYTDEWSAAEQADFTARALARGMASHWSCR